MNEIGAKKAGAAFFRKDRKVDNCHEGALQYFWVRSKIAMPSSSSPLTIIHHHSPDQNILFIIILLVKTSYSSSFSWSRHLTLRPQPSLNVAGSVFRPTAAFQVKLYEEILDKTRLSINIITLVTIIIIITEDLIFVTNITNYICGEKFVMWRNFSFPCMTIVGKLKISPHVEKLQMSSHDRCGEIGNSPHMACV